MPNFDSKLSSAYLSMVNLRDFVDRLPATLLAFHGEVDLTVRFGWACDVDPEDLYKPIRLKMTALSEFVADAMSREVFDLGDADLHIVVPEHRLEILICHERDIHLDGDDEAAVANVVNAFPKLGFRDVKDRTRASLNTPGLR